MYILTLYVFKAMVENVIHKICAIIESLLLLRMPHYINSNEIPAELSRENTCENNILSREKMTVAMVTYLRHVYYKKKILKVKWFGISLVFS